LPADENDEGVVAVFDLVRLVEGFVFIAVTPFGVEALAAIFLAWGAMTGAVALNDGCVKMGDGNKAG
jgi:hypothetical protein